MNAASRHELLRLVVVPEFAMYSLQSNDLEEVARIFAVAPDAVRTLEHPAILNYSVALINFARGGNIAPATASYLNHEFYETPNDIDLDVIHQHPNPWAFVQDTERGRAVAMTVAYPREVFMQRLWNREGEIRYVVQHPEILFMMRPNTSYRTAKLNLQSGYQPAL